ncbi:MAG: hypothetical protein HZB76_05190 [Chlamydiae bacterium]|nr:hypothetical protein [Chlamydiota bacterium]
MASPAQLSCSAATAAPATAIETSHPLSFDEMENEIIQVLKKIYLNESALTSKDITVV